MPETLDLVIADPATLHLWRPEILLVLTFLVALPLSTLGRVRRSWLGRGVTALGLLAAAVTAGLDLHRDGGAVLGPLFVVDPLATATRAVVCLLVLVTALVGAPLRRRDPDGAEIPPDAYPFLPLYALALCLWPQARHLLAVVVTVMGGVLAGILVAGLAVRTAAARLVCLRHGLAGAVGSAVLVYGLSLRYPLTGTTLIAAMPQAPAAPAIAVLVLTLVGLQLVAWNSPPLWTVSRRESGEKLPPVIAGLLASAPVFAGATLLWHLIGPARAWSTAFLTLAAVALAAGAAAAWRQKQLPERLAWLAASQVGYALLALVVPPPGRAPILLHLGLFALANLGALSVVQLGPRARWAGWFGAVFLVGLVVLPLRLVMALVRMDLVLPAAVAGVGVVGSIAYLRGLREVVPRDPAG